MPGKYNKAYRRALREREGRVNKEIEFPESDWTDFKTHVDRLNAAGKKWTLWGAIYEAMRLFIKHHK